MVYSIFVSHTELDVKIAEEVTRIIKKAFGGHIDPYLAVENLESATPWKVELKQRLEACDAIISIITPRSLEKRWIYVEWAAFWLSDRPSFILVTDDVEISDLLSPMGDLQIAALSSKKQVADLFDGLVKFSQYKKDVPSEFVDEFVASYQNAEKLVLQEVAKLSYEKYKNDPLPNDKEERRKIAKYFIDKGDFATFRKILPRLTVGKVQIARELIEAGDLTHTAEIVDTLNAASSSKSIGKVLFDKGYEDDPLMKEVIDRATKSHTELKALGRYIFQAYGEDSDVFRYIIDSFVNLAELRNLGQYFIDDDRVASPAFEYLVKRIEAQGKPVQLGNLAIGFIKHDMTDRPQFKFIITILEKHQSRAEGLLTYWVQEDRQSAENALNNDTITDPSLREFLKQLLG